MWIKLPIGEVDGVMPSGLWVNAAWVKAVAVNKNLVTVYLGDNGTVTFRARGRRHAARVARAILEAYVDQA